MPLYTQWAITQTKLLLWLIVLFFCNEAVHTLEIFFIQPDEETYYILIYLGLYIYFRRFLKFWENIPCLPPPHTHWLTNDDCPLSSLQSPQPPVSSCLPHLCGHMCSVYDLPWSHSDEKRRPPLMEKPWPRGSNRGDSLPLRLPLYPGAP